MKAAWFESFGAPSDTITIGEIEKPTQGKGEGWVKECLGNIRDTDALLHVLRCLDDDNIGHVDGQVNPSRDKETIDMELKHKDLETVDKK